MKAALGIHGTESQRLESQTVFPRRRTKTIQTCLHTRKATGKKPGGWLGPGLAETYNLSTCSLSKV
jgi:hypothetical protein